MLCEASPFAVQVRGKGGENPKPAWILSSCLDSGHSFAQGFTVRPPVYHAVQCRLEKSWSGILKWARLEGCSRIGKAFVKSYLGHDSSPINSLNVD